jgi:pimeloyl-ACP methyl ester carboxylesterase
MTPSIDELVHHRYAYVGGIRLHYVEWKQARDDAPVVLLLHGFPEFWYVWRHQLVALGEAGYRVVAPDLRGYGQSDKPQGIDAYQIETLTDDVAALIHELGVEQASIVAHDWGGMVAWWHAMRHTEQVRTLSILNCPHPALRARMMADPAQLKRSLYMFAFQLPRIPEAVLRWNDHAIVRKVLRTDSTALTDADIQRYADALDPASTTAALNYYRAYLRRGKSLAKQLRPIDVPTQVIWGTGDRHLGIEYANPPTRWVWNVRVEKLEGYSHWVQADAAAEVNRRLLAFLPPP